MTKSFSYEKNGNLQIEVTFNKNIERILEIG